MKRLLIWILSTYNGAMTFTVCIVILTVVACWYLGHVVT